MTKPTYANVIGFYIEPAVRPAENFMRPTGKVDRETGELLMEPDPGMTKQSFKEECDINNIVRRFEATGQLDHINQAAAQGLYIDLPDGLDLQSSLNMIAQADAAFMALPADVRAEFQNDPVQFVEAFQNPTEAQAERFERLGLLSIRRPETPPAAPQAPPATPPAAPPLVPEAK